MDKRWHELLKKIEYSKIIFNNLKNYKPKKADLLPFPIYARAIKVNRNCGKIGVFETVYDIRNAQREICDE